MRSKLLDPWGSTAVLAVFVSLSAAGCGGGPQHRPEFVQGDVESDPSAGPPTMLAGPDAPIGVDDRDDKATSDNFEDDVESRTWDSEDAGRAVGMEAIDTTDGSRDDDSENEDATPIVLEKDITTVPDGELIAELQRRALEGWILVDWSESGRARAAALVVSSSLLDAGSDPSSANTDAVRAAAEELREATSVEHSLLAAAAFQRLGDAEAARECVTKFAPSGAGNSELTEPAAASVFSLTPGDTSFAVTALTFARRIYGPTKLETLPAKEIKPGLKLLVYGELENVRSIKRAPRKKNGKPTFWRCFQARLRLLDATDNVIDEIDFLPPDRGWQSVATPDELVNFWARYTIPKDLKPGSYTIVIDAQDVLGHAKASGSLKFRIATRAKPKIGGKRLQRTRSKREPRGK